jgi:hypothetical protein
MFFRMHLGSLTEPLLAAWRITTESNLRLPCRGSDS